MRVYLNRSIVDGPWGGGNRWLRAIETALVERGHQLSSIAAADVLVACGLDRCGSHPSADELIAVRKPLVFRANDCDSRKGTVGVDERSRAVAHSANRVVCVSHWLKRELRLPDADVIVNGVDTSLFKPAARAPGLPLIVTHHWSDNPLKGADWYSELDAMAARGVIRFKFIGRPCVPLKHAEVVPPLDVPELAAELASAHAYVSGTVNDPGPNHVLEALACGLPIVVKATGGGAVEFAGEECAIERAELRTLVEERGWATSRQRVSAWRDSTAAFVRVLEEVADDPLR